MRMRLFFLILTVCWWSSIEAQLGYQLAESLGQSQPYQDAPYDFLNPDKIYELPDILREISGIAVANDHTLYCIQDEAGTVFSYDLDKEEISGTMEFTGAGDFEDVFIKNELVYVLRSDGDVFYFSPENYTQNVTEVKVPLNCMNIEGACFNRFENLIYFACKAQLINDSEEKRVIFQVAPDRMNEPTVAFSLDTKEIQHRVTEKFPMIAEEDIRFNPSAIAVHPFTREKYVLSSSKRFLAIFNDSGMRKIYPLPKELYRQPEGLAFTEAGDLYISSEGKKLGKGQILFFKHR